MKFGHKEIDDECTKCGRIFECELFKAGHGIDCQRSNVTDMVKCQFEHLDKRKGGKDYGSEQKNPLPYSVTGKKNNQ